MVWNENSIKPSAEGFYLTTHLVAQMCGSYDSGSYAWECHISYFDGEYWEDSGVLAWTELPCAYYTPDDEKKEKLLQVAFENDVLYEEKMRKAMYRFNLKSSSNKCPW